MPVAVTRNDHVVIGAHENLLVIVWFQTPTMEDFGLVESATTDLIEQIPDGIGLLIIVADGIDKPPPQEVRRRNAELVARYAGQIWGMARVIEGRGVKLSMLRFVFSTIDLLSSSALKEKTVESVDEAAAWLSSLEPQLRARGVTSEVERLRRTMPVAKALERPAARAR